MRYRILGRQPVLRTPPGMYVEADLTPEQEARMVARGSLERAPKPRGRTKPADPTPDDTTGKESSDGQAGTA